MIAGANGSHLGLLSFLSFAFSVMAAVLAIDMYALLRTGEFGSTWRVLIIASVMFVLVQALRLAQLVNPRIADYGLSEVAELMFVMALAYAFFLQRRAFARTASLREAAERRQQPRIAERTRRIPSFRVSQRNAAWRANDSTPDHEPGTQSSLHAPPDDAAALENRAESDDASELVADDLEDDPDIEWSRSPQRDVENLATLSTKPPMQTSL